ncbi:MAG: HD domain-containing protein, partial [Pyrinomonadaceae bacterium]
ENSAEHSWQVALLALALVKFADQPIDIDKVLKMIILHELGEIDADDTFFFDESGRAAAKEKESIAVKRITGILPEEIGKEFYEIWDEFENGTSAEAKFARAIDRAMPVLQNLYNNKQSWLENNITKEQILAKTSYIGDAGAIVWESISEKIEAAFD